MEAAAAAYHNMFQTGQCAVWDKKCACNSRKGKPIGPKICTVGEHVDMCYPWKFQENRLSEAKDTVSYINLKVSFSLFLFSFSSFSSSYPCSFESCVAGSDLRFCTCILHDKCFMSKFVFFRFLLFSIFKKSKTVKNWRFARFLCYRIGGKHRLRPIKHAKTWKCSVLQEKQKTRLLSSFVMI